MHVRLHGVSRVPVHLLIASPLCCSPPRVDCVVKVVVFLFLRTLRDLLLSFHRDIALPILYCRLHIRSAGLRVSDGRRHPPEIASA